MSDIQPAIQGRATTELIKSAAFTNEIICDPAEIAALVRLQKATPIPRYASNRLSPTRVGIVDEKSRGRECKR
jgi:hypothetical protein